jgi:hypothetical protein
MAATADSSTTLRSGRNDKFLVASRNLFRTVVRAGGSPSFVSGRSATKLDSRLRGNDEILSPIGISEEQTTAMASILKHLSLKMLANAGVCISNYVN